MEAAQLAHAIGVGRTTLWRWTRAGLLPQPERRGRLSIYGPVAVTLAGRLSEAAR